MRTQGREMRRKATLASGLLLAVAYGGCSTNPEKGKVKYLESGQRYMQKGKYQEATIQFRNALKLDPRFVEAFYQLAQAEIAQNQWRQAYEALERTIELDAGRLDARLDRGRLYLAAHEFQRAKDEANFILERNPENAAAYQLMGAALVATRDTEKAEGAFEKIAELLPNEASSYINLSLLELSLRRFDDAEKHLLKACDVDPHSIQAFSDLASFYRIKGDLARAHDTLQRGISQNPNSPGLYIARADLLYSQQKNDEANEVLVQLRQQGNVADISLAIGDFYLQRQQTSLALQEYQRGLNSAPNNFEIKKRMEEVYLVTGETEKAADFDKALLNTKSKDPIILINHGRLLLAQGKVDDAIAELQREIKDVSELPQIHYYLALAYVKKGNLQQAKSQMEEASRTAPDQIDILNGLARMHLQQGDLNLAQQNAERSLQLRGTDTTMRLLLASIYEKQAKFDLANEQLAVAEKLAPEDPVVHVQYAALYRSQHSWAQAEKQLETALRLKPHDPEMLGQLMDMLVESKQNAKADKKIHKRYANGSYRHNQARKIDLADQGGIIDKTVRSLT